MAASQTYPMFVGGRPRVSEEAERRPVVSPGSGDTLGAIQLGGPADVDAAVAGARDAADTLAGMTPFERAELCTRAAEAIEANADDLAGLLSAEHGKPRHGEAAGEVAGSAGAFRDAGEQVKWMRSEMVAARDPSKRVLVHRRPRGVYGVITPWNFPLGVACIYYLGPGLAAGNALVWVPAPSTAAVASRLVEVLDDAGLPSGALSLVTGEGSVVGDALVRHRGVDAVGFTGSTATGTKVAAAAAGKPCLLELGGNGPTVVLEDADVDLAAAAIAGGSFANAGQVCTATERILVHDSVADALGEHLAAHAAKLVLGDPLDPATTLGPVHTREVADRVVDQVAEATARGARLLAGGERLADAPTAHYVRPTVVDRVPGDTALHAEETFGPVAPLTRWSAESELPALVSASPYGLSGAVFGEMEHAMVVAESMPCGIVNVNETSAYWEPQIPAGGAAGTASGHGRSGGPWSVLEMTETRTVVLSTTRKAPS